MSDDIPAVTPPYFQPGRAAEPRQETAGAVAWGQDGRLYQYWHVMVYGPGAARAFTEWRIVPLREIDGMVERIGWYMAKFSNAEGGPVYLMLHEVAAVTPAKLAGDALLSVAALGARVVMKSGIALYTAESADTVFEEVRRANTTSPPPEPKIRLDGTPGPSAEPAPVVSIPEFLPR